MLRNHSGGTHQLYTEQILREVLLGLHSTCKGADAQFFNGHTNITSSRFLVFGVKGLLGAAKNVRNAMLFNTLSFMSDKLLTEGNTVAALDELYIWLSNPTAIEYIRNALKRVRKKESAMLLASQNLEDFDQERIREMTKPLFSIPPHQFLFNAGSIDKRSYMEMLQLDEAEYNLIQSILQNEKYCGDVLMQKTFQQDVINRKVIKNTGQLPMYLIENHHEGIVTRKKYHSVQTEMARRKAARSPSKRAATGLTSYTSRYALSDRLVCGECGTLYRRCTWTRPDGKRIVWRCVSRLDYGRKYCHNSPTLDEAPLQQAILAAINTAMADKDSLIRQIKGAMEAEIIPFPGSAMSLGDIDRRLAKLETQFQRLLEKAADDPIPYGSQFKEILDEQTSLKELRTSILVEDKEHAEANQRIKDAAEVLENASPYTTEWDETAIRQLVTQVKVLSKNEISVTLKGGVEICQTLNSNMM